MSKSKVYGVKERRRKAIERLKLQAKDLKKAIEPKSETKVSKKIKKIKGDESEFVKQLNRINKELDDLEAKKNYSRKNK